MVLAGSKEGKMIQQIMQNQPSEVKGIFDAIITPMVLAGAIFVVLMGYGVSRLIAASNAFTAISYSGKREDIIKAFRNLKMYWMIYGVSAILAVVFGLYIIIKVIAIAQELGSR